MLKPLHIYLSLCLLFLLYSFSIYIQPAVKTAYFPDYVKASEGRLIWQKYNCQSCHQLYGLGGYLGPDLTNIMSRKNAEAVVKGMLENGSGAMPAYNMQNEEMQLLLTFLRSTDASGKSDPRTFKILPTGIIEKK